jgi:hypothetical protein
MIMCIRPAIPPTCIKYSQLQLGVTGTQSWRLEPTLCETKCHVRILFQFYIGFQLPGVRLTRLDRRNKAGGRDKNAPLPSVLRLSSSLAHRHSLSATMSSRRTHSHTYTEDPQCSGTKPLSPRPPPRSPNTSNPLNHCLPRPNSSRSQWDHVGWGQY